MAIYTSNRPSSVSLVADERVSISNANTTALLENFSEELYNINAATYIGDIQLEQSVSEGYNVEPLIEGFISSMVDKIIAKLKEFGNKILGWFKSLKRYFELMFKHGAEFIKRFKKDIEDRSVSGFEYEGYPYKISETKEVSSSIDRNNNKGESILAEMQKFSDNPEDSEIIKKYKQEPALNAADEFSKFLKREFKTDDKSEIIKSIKEEIRGGDSKETITDFNKGPSVSEMIKHIEGKAGMDKEIIATEREMRKATEIMIDSLEKIKKKVSDNADIRGGATRAIQFYTSYIKNVLTFSLTLTQVGKDMCGEMASAFESVLKAYLRFKPAKTTESSVDGFLFENAMRLV